MNQDKLEVIKQEMARVNIDIVGISEIKRGVSFHSCSSKAQPLLLTSDVG